MHLCSVCCPLDKSEKDQETINEFLRGMPPKPPAPLPPIVGEVVIPAHTTVLQLASVLSQKPFRIIEDLMEFGVFANVNHELDFDTVGKVTRKHGYTAKRTA